MPASRRPEVSVRFSRRSFRCRYKSFPPRPLRHSKNPLFQRKGNPAFSETGASDASAAGLCSADSTGPADYHNPHIRTGPSPYSFPSNIRAYLPLLLPLLAGTDSALRFVRSVFLVPDLSKQFGLSSSSSFYTRGCCTVFPARTTASVLYLFLFLLYFFTSHKMPCSIWLSRIHPPWNLPHTAHACSGSAHRYRSHPYRKLPGCKRSFRRRPHRFFQVLRSDMQHWHRQRFFAGFPDILHWHRWNRSFLWNRCIC